MPGRILSLIGSIAVAVVVSAAGIDLPTNSAYANDCVAVPNAAAPQGQHWYYRVDRPHHRKCWYLHAVLLPLHRAAIKRAEHHGISTAANVPMPQSIEGGAAGSAPTPARAAKPQLVPFIRTMAEELGQQSAEEDADRPSIPQEPDAPTLRSDAHTDISGDPRDAAASDEPTGTAGIAGALRLIFLLLGSALAIAGLLVHIMIKIVGGHRFQIPEAAWFGRQSFDDRFDRQAQDERREERRRLGSADPRSRERFAARQQATKEFPPLSTRRAAARSRNTAATAAETPRPDAKGIERALRALKQARQHQDA